MKLLTKHGGVLLLTSFGSTGLSIQYNNNSEVRLHIAPNQVILETKFKCNKEQNQVLRVSASEDIVEIEITNMGGPPAIYAIRSIEVFEINRKCLRNAGFVYL